MKKSHIVFPFPLIAIIYQSIRSNIRASLSFFLIFLVSIHLNAQQCYISLSPNPVEFPLSGGGLWVDVIYPPFSCDSGSGISIYDIPSWVTAYVQGGDIFVSAGSTGSYRTASIPVRSNGITVNAITIKQGTPPPPPPPPPCLVSGFGGNAFNPLGQTITYPISFSNCGGTSATFSFQTTSGQSVPGWVGLSQNGTSITVTLGPNATNSHRTVVILASTTVGGNPYTIGAQISQASCLKTWYLDADNDGHAISTQSACTSPGVGYSLTVKPLGDCNDSNATVYPGAPEICNDGIDNNCNGSTDENRPSVASGTDKSRCGPGTVTLTASPVGGNNIRWYTTATGGTPLATSTSYTTPSLSATTAYYAESYSTLLPCAAPTRKKIQAIINAVPIWYADADGDGLGDPSVSMFACTVPSGYVTNNTDRCPNEAGSYYGCIYTLSTPSANENYIYTRVFQRPMDSVSEINRDTDIIEHITYFDGLGRPKQAIGIKASPDKKDIITHVGYDGFGRQDRDWLPYYEATGNVGSHRGDRSLATQQYYQAHYPSDFLGVTNAQDITAFSQKGFEASPLNRVVLQAAPGESWKLGSGNEIGFGYLANAASEVISFGVDITASVVDGINVFEPVLVQNVTYGAGELYKTVTRDENWISGTSPAHTTEEFKDKQGRIILKRTYGDSDTNMDGTILGTSEVNVAHDTYYVYDDYGNLSYVIPPKVNVSDGVSATELSELCYQYRYDGRNRLVEKKIPGRDWEYIIYNKVDQPIATQDANLRENDELLYTLYDNFGRVAFTAGMSGVDMSRTMMQASADMVVTQSVSATTSPITIAGTPVYYATGDLLVDLISDMRTINYYDTYRDLPAGLTSTATTYYGLVSSTKVKGLPTVGKIRVLDSGTVAWITTVTYYDGKGRPIYTYVANPYLGTVDIMESRLDFTGRVLETRTTHKKTGKDDIVALETFTYDHVGRILSHRNKIGSLPEETIVENTYDNLGQLTIKGVGGMASSGIRLQTVNYAYNVRGWLKQINNPANLGGDLFAFGINYNTVGHGGTPLYNGNISETEWRTANTDNGLKWYRYGYDALNRIAYGINVNGRYNLGSETSPLTYDKNGNLTFLTRNGHVVANPGSGNSGDFGSMDRLYYYYDSNSNKLRKVTDFQNKDYGFRDGTNTGNDYTYDTNGNMLSDANKGITSVLYNHLNMPTEIKFNNSNTQKINYTYAADRTKLRKVKTEGASVTTTDYAGNFVYENNVLKQFSHPEGYVEPDGSGYQYVYRLTDMWGNTRITFADDDNNGSVNSSEIRREQNYYPFGMEHKGYNISSYGAKNNLKTYQKQEFTEDLGLNTHEWKYRVSDPSIGRFWQIDPLAEDYVYNSTYAFQENKLGMGTELEGKELRKWLFDVGTRLGLVDANHPQNNPYSSRARNDIGYQIEQHNKESSTSSGPTKNITGNYFGDAAFKLLGGETLSKAIDGDDRAQGQVIMGAIVALAPSGKGNIADDVIGAEVKVAARGAANPKVRASLDAGKKAHADFTQRANSKGWQTNVPMKDPATGNTIYADAVTPSGHPVELKPNTPTGIAKGNKQLPKYENATGENGRVIFYDVSKYFKQ